jgi:adenylate cyclase
MNNLEIERKFLVKGSSYPWIGPRWHIMQGYVTDNTQCLVRFRHQTALDTPQEDTQAFVTVKSYQSWACNREYETAVDPDWAMTVISEVAAWKIIKTRTYWTAPDGCVWHIDHFANGNQGLVIAEIELQSPEQTFYRPSSLGPEVTGDPRYGNISLAKNPWTTWRT